MGLNSQFCRLGVVRKVLDPQRGGGEVKFEHLIIYEKCPFQDSDDGSSIQARWNEGLSQRRVEYLLK